MNKKGFTLIELLATITILSMILVVAVPSIMSTLDKSKRRTYVEDAKKMISLAEYRMRGDTSIEYPSSTTTAVAFTLASMDLTDFSEGPEGGQYDLNRSYVLLVKKNNQYYYYVTLIENYNSKYRGVEMMSYDDLLKDVAINNVKDFKGTTLPSAPTQYGYKNGYYITQVVNEKK